jgi:hypothetical protein
MSQTLEQRHASIFSRFMRELFGELHSVYWRKNPGITFDDLWVGMAIYSYCDTDDPAVSYSQLEADTGLASSSLERITAALIAEGMIAQVATHPVIKFACSPAYTSAQEADERAGHTRRVRDIILKYADELREVWGLTILGITILGTL